MKHLLFKTLLCLTAVALFGLGLAADVSALESQVVLKDTGNLVTTPGDDLFTELKDMMPGDVGTQTILIHNQYYKKVRLYLKTEAAGSLLDGERKLSAKLLDELELTLTLSRPGKADTTLYSGPASGDPDKEIVLGTYAKGDKATITATLTVPETLGNEFQDAVGKVKWVFYCKEVTTTSSSSTESETKSDVPAMTTLRMPETGGFPVEMLLPMGAVLLVGGLVLGRKKR